MFRCCAVILFAAVASVLQSAARSGPPEDRLVRDRYGAIIRGDLKTTKLALVFTGGDFGEGTADILDALKERGVKGGFFVTGAFIRQPALRPLVARAVAEGHYVGPHSDSHPLYCSWEDREKSLVAQASFAADLRKNVADLREVGALRGDAPQLFIPPYEWYNQDQVRWSCGMGLTLINFTPGSGSTRDYAPEGDPRFVPSRTIYRDILAYEDKDHHGLNGFILLLHLGSGRKDPFHPRLGALCDDLARRGYEFERIDRLLKPECK